MERIAIWIFCAALYWDAFKKWMKESRYRWVIPSLSCITGVLLGWWIFSNQAYHIFSGNLLVEVPALRDNCRHPLLTFQGDTVVMSLECGDMSVYTKKLKCIWDDLSCYLPLSDGTGMVDMSSVSRIRVIEGDEFWMVMDHEN